MTDNQEKANRIFSRLPLPNELQVRLDPVHSHLFKASSRDLQSAIEASGINRFNFLHDQLHHQLKKNTIWPFPNNNFTDVFKSNLSHQHLFLNNYNDLRKVLEANGHNRFAYMHDLLHAAFEFPEYANQFGRAYSAGKLDLDTIGETVRQIAEGAKELLGLVPVDSSYIETVQELENTSKGEGLFYQEALKGLVEGLPNNRAGEPSISLYEYIRKIPPKARWAFWILFCCVVLPSLKAVLDDIAVGLVSDSLKPKIRTYICNQPWATNKVISELICSSAGGELPSNRFVKADILNVRKTPNSSGEVIDKLPRFEPVTLIRKNENLSWSLIRYKNDDDEVMEGWVFSRYLYKPSKY